jgi:hypothetical protein
MIMNKRFFAFILVAAAPLLGACEGDDSDVTVFRAQLRQINEQQSFTVPGATVEFLFEEGGMMEVRLQGLGLDAVSHPTFLRSGDTCPTMEADTNEDGIIDIVEGRAAYGEAVLALDGNLSTYQIEAGTFPFGSAPTYVMTDFVEDVVSAILNQPHVEPVDLDVDNALAFGGRTVVIHGVAPEVLVDHHDVQGEEGLELPGTVPILCGKVFLVE